ncbi:MAG TPA: C25 family cysteine peptidase [Bacteroidales bacterium]|nr:C25 family cysteine peptidase [Bacteroidales bacterium]
MMKLMFLPLGMFFLLFLSTQAATIQKTYTFNDYTLIQKGDHSLITFEDCYLKGIQGEPVLPWYAVRLLLPPGHEAISVEFLGEEEMTLPGTYQIYPEQYVQPISSGKSGIFIKNDRIYSTDQPYPSTPAGKLSTEFLKGYSIALSAFTPMTYNPVTGTITYFQKVTIRLETRESSSSRQALALLSSSASSGEYLRQFIQNSEAISSYPAGISRDETYACLIITPDQFAASFDELRSHYLKCGLESSVITTEAIAANYSGGDLQEKIRNCILQEYADHETEYVLLGGDVEHIPYRGFYCMVQSSSVYESSNIPSDLYYSGLDGTWNDNGNTKWGEIGEDDLLPDVAVTRLPFGTQAELDKMLHKVLSYQQNPIPGELRDPLLAGEHLYDNPETWGSDYLELLVGYHDDNGYTTDGIPEDQNIEKLYEEVTSWGPSTLLATINEGKSFVHHVGHASTTYAMMLSNWDITNSNFSQVNGVDHNYTLVYTHGCDCGGFDYNDCILEEMVKIDNFAAAVVGNSRYGWFNEGQTEGPSAHLHREFVDALYHDRLNRIGRAHMESRIETSVWVNAPGQWEEGALRWCFYDCNVLGETAMPIWTDEPFTPDVTYLSAIPIDQTSLDVIVSYEGDPLQDIRCVVIQDDVLFGLGVTDATGQATISFEQAFTEPGQAQLVISGYNCLTTTYPITIIPSQGAYLVYATHSIEDTDGNGNGIPEFGESIFLSIDITNVGQQTAENATVVLSCDETYITLTDDEENYGTIAGGETLSIENGFALEIADDIPDQLTVDFQLAVTAAETWTSGFSITFSAPLLILGNLSVNDQQEGNGNGILDPGETAYLLIRTGNMGHCATAEVTGLITTTDPLLEINDGLFQSGPLAVFETVQASYQVTLDPSTPAGTIVKLSCNLTSGAYELSKEYQLETGVITEDFETGDFTRHNWQFGGNAPWVISEINPFEGLYSARSGEIDDQETSEMMITAEVLADDSIGFHYRVSSETDYDYLEFYVDNVKKGSWSGNLGWSYASYPVTTGLRTFQWKYVKDWMSSSGEDAAWVDYISFPPIYTPVSVDEIPDSFTLTVYPNPSRSHLVLEYEFRQVTPVHFLLMNTTGQTILEHRLPSASTPCSGTVSLDISGLEQGVYYLRAVTPTGSIVRKIIKIQ